MEAAKLIICLFCFYIFLNVQADDDESQDLKCCPNEVEDQCPADCPSQQCAKEAGQSTSCPTPNPCPPPACKCEFNYKRADNGTCIPATDCPPFPCQEYERFDPCPPICPSDGCGSKDLNGICPYKIGIRLICNAKCRCIEGYFRNDEGKCIPKDQCPPICPIGEEADNCPSDCPSNYCPKSAEDDQTSCPTPNPCPKKPGCKCKINYKRADNGTCIPTRDCPPFECPCNEEYNSCPTLCSSDDCKDKDRNGTCPAGTKIGVLLICKPACRCVEDYFRDDGVCVPRDECPCE